MSHTLAQPPQFDVVLVGVSHPAVSGAVVTQLAHPGCQLVYWQVVPLQLAPLLWVVSQTLAQPPQFDVVFVGVSHPAESGEVVLQLAHPGTQLAVNWAAVGGVTFRF